MQPLRVQGFDIYKGWLDLAAQQALAASLRDVVRAAPMVHQETPGGRKMSVKMTSAGALGWTSDRKGYRYAPQHPAGTDRPEIPEPILAVWRDLVSADRLPESCLVNFYGEGAKMGLHVDDTEGDVDWPVLSISLGDEAMFRMGGLERSDPTRSIWLQSGDIVIMGGAARLAYHGIDRIKFRSSTLLPKGGRLNITLRAVARDRRPT
ncbi:alpha-ketoglutarate-dependent dioxygenase AlkB family protein [Paracoccaceae bacterium GXU_MW_L88]